MAERRCARRCARPPRGRAVDRRSWRAGARPPTATRPATRRGDRRGWRAVAPPPPATRPAARGGPRSYIGRDSDPTLAVSAAMSRVVRLLLPELLVPGPPVPLAHEHPRITRLVDALPDRDD